MIAQFRRFVVVGVLGTVADVAMLWMLLRAGVWPPAAVTVAYGAATAGQFLLNRHYSFANFDRTAGAQARTYVVVSGVNWVVALAFVQTGSHFGMPALAAKALSIPPSVLVGFAGNRYLTFGPGLRARLRDVRHRGDRRAASN